MEEGQLDVQSHHHAYSIHNHRTLRRGFESRGAFWQERASEGVVLARTPVCSRNTERPHSLLVALQYPAKTDANTTGPSSLERWQKTWPWAHVAGT